MRKVIRSAVDRGVCSGTIDLARRAQISKSTLSALLHGQKAGLDTWVRIALAADVSLPGLFAPDLWAENVTGKCLSWRSVQSEARQRPPLDWYGVRQDVIRRIEGPDAISVYELGRTLHADAKYLKVKLGPLALRLNEAAAAQRRRDLMEHVSSIALRIREEAAELRAEGRRVSARSLARRTGQARASIAFVLALREAAADIGRPLIRGPARIKDCGR
jgi:transcriptional regulator with XRE-family HTH domain